MNELSWHWTFNQPFSYEPTLGPESVWEGIEVSRIALDSEEVDGCRIPFWNVAELSEGPGVSYGFTSEGIVKGVEFDVLRS